MTNDQAERLIAAVERLAAAAEALVQGQQRKASSPAKFIKPIEEFPSFDWSSIGAKIEYRDSDRIVAAVSWGGFTYERKQKHGDVWFSRNAGRDDEGNLCYETLVKFAANVAPSSLPTNMVKAFESQPQPQPPQQPQRSSQSQPVVKETISQKQYQDLQARAKQNDYSTAGFAKLLTKFGFSRGSEVTQKAYPQLWTEAGDRNQAALMNTLAK
jgi:hypothetical protein